MNIHKIWGRVGQKWLPPVLIASCASSDETIPNRKGMAAAMAINRFEKGPANETHIIAAGERR